MDKPVPGEKEVLIEVRAVSVNDWDVGLLLGVPFLNRVMGGLFRPRKRILGSDIAGTVVQVGGKVERFRPGDEVFGDLSGAWGGFAEYVCASEDAIALKSPGMTFEQAAAFPQAAMLAIQGLRDVGQVRSGQKVLINGAGGGVGTFGVQLAKLHGVEITGVDSAEKLDLMRSMGFDHVLDYARVDFTRDGRRYDLILDAKTNRSIFDCARALNPGGTYVTVGGSLLRLLQALLVGPLIRLLSRKGIRIVALKPNKDLEYVKELFDAGKLRPVIDGPFPLSQVPEALRRFEEGRHKGKIVISLAQG